MSILAWQRFDIVQRLTAVSNKKSELFLSGMAECIILEEVDMKGGIGRNG